jgi:hypothetical protein
MTRRLLVILTLIVAQSIPTTAQSREKSLDNWLDADLVPYVQQQLVKHPRFKNETVMFVVLQDNVPASISNELALSLRDRLLEAAIDSSGVSVGWQQGRSGATLESRPDDCLHDKVHYYIGLELSQELDSRYSVTVRALDLDDRTWVTGFGKQWHGRLSTIQRQAMRQQRVDETFLGARDVPFTLAQTDLLAANLAHQLSCTLKQQMEEDYVVSTSESSVVSDSLVGTVELIGNNLANRNALRLTADSEKANATLSGKAHQISNVLYQYWLTVTPNSDNEELTALSVSAYVVVPDARPLRGNRPPATEHAPAIATVSTLKLEKKYAISIPNSGKDGLISPLRISAPQSGAECFWPCSLLQTRANTDAIVFFLEHQANHGLVRLAGENCRQRTAARVARNGEVLQFPIARTTTLSSNWSETFDWETATEADTYYAVVVTNSDVARRLANHIDSLPQRCSTSMRPGLKDSELKEWLSDFATITAKSSQYIDWRAIQVRDIT